MRLSQLLAMTRPAAVNVWEDCRAASPDAESKPGVLFISACTGKDRAHVVVARSREFDSAWRRGAQLLNAWQRHGTALPVLWLRVDVVHTVHEMTWETLEKGLAVTKRNYFRFGIAFDEAFSVAMLEPEIGANAVLYDGTTNEATPNETNLKRYGQRRFGHELKWPTQPQEPVWLFETRTVFTDGKAVHRVEHQGRNRGYRMLPTWDAAYVREVITTSAGYLARQVTSSGKYHYGWFPCFDRAIPTYNTLRHASSTYAMLEGWELTRDPQHKASIDKALVHLTEHFIHHVTLPSGEQVAFLVDTGDEIKLGGNAVCLLALSKYTELTGDTRYIPLLEKLALGILHMQNPSTGRFVHVLHYPDLNVKEESRIIYYDGEAAFGLMRLYGLTKDPRWLQAVERAVGYFIEAKHWKAHDHWLSYCINELTRYKPEARYFTFGLDNVRDHLDFVLERITTFPTLLELMMAAERMIVRLQSTPELSHLLEGFDLDKFYSALEQRARYLMTGHFFPELAMFFKNPARVVGSFFIRHHGFRVRIDDVEHYLSGFVAYLKYLDQRASAPKHIQRNASDMQVVA
ncbi:Mur ligase [Paraburkholderia sp. HD33-4]|uniref:Mur ligase n=1 Tax=Paraburkholderia sp. HD33-4 TaxID=2883242 RepID=UPI001F2C7559|nr:Mur ligase [Paraburkholderia sp. HD33-4]